MPYSHNQGQEIKKNGKRPLQQVRERTYSHVKAKAVKAADSYQARHFKRGIFLSAWIIAENKSGTGE